MDSEKTEFSTFAESTFKKIPERRKIRKVYINNALFISISGTIKRAKKHVIFSYIDRV